MSVLIREELGNLQESFLEPNDSGQSYPSGLWTPEEIWASLNQRQSEFFRRTQVALAEAQLLPAANDPAVDLPGDWIATAEVIFDDGTSAKELPSADVWQSDRVQPTWEGTPADPLVYSDADGATQLELTLQPATSLAGTKIYLLYVAIPDPIDSTPLMVFEVPDEAVPTVMWGVRADALKKIGRAEDLARAAYCESRFEEGILIWQLALSGVM